VKKRIKIDHLSTLCVGLDIGSRNNYITALDFDSNRLINMKPVPNAASGVESMEEMILAVLEANSQFKYLLIAMESTSFYGVHVANYLSTSDRLKPYGVKVFCLNPKEVANYKKSFTGLGKNDGLDSFIVADYIRVGRIAIEPWRGAQYLALQRLTRQRRHVTEAITREKNYVLNNVFLKFSEFALLDGEQSPLKNKFGATAEAILTEFKTTEDIAGAPLEELVEFVTATGRGRFSDPNQVAELLQKAARDSYRLDKSLYEPITASIACSFNCIRAFEREQKALDKAIAQTVAGLNPTEYQILLSIPGIGPVYAAGILAEIGSVRCFKSNDALAKYSGIVWRDNQSDEFESDDTPMIKAGNRYLRYYLIQAAGSVATYCPEYAAFYEKKHAEVSKHQHKRALALTARKLIRLIFGLLDKNQLYSAAKG
jgi:transposase